MCVSVTAAGARAGPGHMRRTRVYVCWVCIALCSLSWALKPQHSLGSHINKNEPYPSGFSLLPPSPAILHRQEVEYDFFLSSNLTMTISFILLQQNR